MPKTGSRVRSAKGKMVDFDLLKIKRQIAGKPVTIDVKARQAFIDQKARRRIRKQAKQAAATVAINDSILKAEPTEAQPMVEQPKPQPQVVDVSREEHKHTKQKVRPPRE